MIEVFTLVLQVAIFAVLIVIIVETYRAMKLTRQTGVLIEQYRREIRWLSDRLDAIDLSDRLDRGKGK